MAANLSKEGGERRWNLRRCEKIEEESDETYELVSMDWGLVSVEKGGKDVEVLKRWGFGVVKGWGIQDEKKLCLKFNYYLWFLFFLFPYR